MKKTNSPKLLLLTGNPTESSTFSKIVQGLGYEVIEESSLGKGLRFLENEKSADVIFLSSTIPDVPFPDSLFEIRRVKNSVPVAVILDKTDSQNAFFALQLGSFDCVAPPFYPSEIIAVVKRGLSMAGMLPKEQQPSLRVQQILSHWGSAVAVGVISVLLLAGGMFWQSGRKQRQFQESERVLELPYSYPTSISSDGERIWICDWLNQSLYGHSPQSGFAIEKIHRIAPINPSLIALDKELLWIIGADKKIYKYSRSKNMQLLQSYVTPQNMNISGLAWDGKYLSFLNNSKPQVLAYIPGTSLVLSTSYALPEGDYSGLFWDGQYYWSTIPKEQKVVRFRIQDNLAEEDLSFRHPLFREKNWKPTGIACDGNSCWLIFENSPHILKIPKGRVSGFGQ